jgi:hypothetical protein
MLLSELQRQNLIVKMFLQNPNKSKSETVEHFKLLGFKILTIYRIQLKGLTRARKSGEKNWFWEKM